MVTAEHKWAASTRRCERMAAILHAYGDFDPEDSKVKDPEKAMLFKQLRRMCILQHERRIRLNMANVVKKA